MSVIFLFIIKFIVMKYLMHVLIIVGWLRLTRDIQYVFPYRNPNYPCFMVSDKIFVLSPEAFLCSIAVWIFTTIINTFNCSVEEFCNDDIGWTLFDMKACEWPVRCFPMAKCYLAYPMLIYFNSSNIDLCHTFCIFHMIWAFCLDYL